METTNNFNLPDPYVQAVKNDSYKRGDCDFTITELVGPARLHALLHKYGDTLSEDASTRSWALLGQCAHEMVSRCGTGLKEGRLFLPLGGYRIAGGYDHISKEGSTLTDWKITSVFAAQKGEPVKPEWVSQLNCLRYLAHHHGIKGIKNQQIMAIYRDWRYGETWKRNYPKPVEAYPVPLWSLIATEKYLLSRIKAHVQARKELPLCTNEETWGGRRCERYCPASRRCSQFLGPALEVSYQTLKCNKETERLRESLAKFYLNLKKEKPLRKGGTFTSKFFNNVFRLKHKGER